MDLGPIEQRIRSQFADLHRLQYSYGCYCGGPDADADLYASLDVALSRVIMGEDLTQTLSVEQRQQWCAYINSYANPDGTYQRFNHHSALHANGMVIGALGPLGGRQPYPVSLYDDFSAVDQVDQWLDAIDWARQWSASHLFWGGMHCFAVSSKATKAWKQRVFAWLDRELDPQTGWWRKGTAHSDRHQALGGSVHILPVYQHLDHPFPYPEQLIDSCLALQLETGCWLQGNEHGMSYLELDALYVFAYAGSQAPDYRGDDIAAAVKRYGDHVEAYWSAHAEERLQQHPHQILACVGIFGLLNQLNPERWPHEKQWTDIFSDQRLYQTDAVSCISHADV